MTEKLTPRKLKTLVGREIGLTEWFAVTQERIDAFAACTEDRQWIHIDAEKAGKSRLGGTVAHGFLLLSLLPHFLAQTPLFQMTFRMAVNYGLNRVRFITSVRSGSRVRNRVALKGLEKRGFRKCLLTLENTLELEGGKKPALVAELLVLIVF
ncbi:MAG: MaoC family dehydratase [Acidobacteriota bacterium]|nr:MaoC family dehydratase [Acidobacteriota bacterium]